MSDYWDTVEGIARDIIEEHGPDEDAWHEAVHESVDGNGFLIYYGRNEAVLDETHNEPDNREVLGMARPDGGWRDLRRTAAYLAMEADVREKLHELKDDYFKCEDCDRVYKNEDGVDGEDLCAACHDKREEGERHEAAEGAGT